MFWTAARIFPTACLCFHLCDDESQSHSGWRPGLTGFLLAALKAAGYLDHIITAWLLIQILATKRDEKILQVEKQSLEEVPYPMLLKSRKTSQQYQIEMSRNLFKYDWTVMCNGTMPMAHAMRQYDTFLIPTHLCHRQLTKALFTNQKWTECFMVGLKDFQRVGSSM